MHKRYFLMRLILYSKQKDRLHVLVMWTLKFNCESNQTPRFRALFTIATLVSPTVRVPRLTLLSCWRVPVYNMSSVLFSLSFILSACLWREYTVPWHVLPLLHCPNVQCPIIKATLFDLAVYRSTLQKMSKATENKADVFLVYATCFHETVHDKSCLYKSVRQIENGFERGFAKHWLNSI